MQISQNTLNKHLSELKWVIQELMCVLPATNTNKAVNSSLGECIERLQYASHNLDMNVKKLTKNKEKNNV